MWTQHDAVKGLRDKEVFREKWVWEDKLFSEERGTVRVLSDVGLSMNILNDKNHKREQKISYLTVKTIIQLRGGEKSSTTGSCLALSCTKSWVSTKKKKKSCQGHWKRIIHLWYFMLCGTVGKAASLSLLQTRYNTTCTGRELKDLSY